MLSSELVERLADLVAERVMAKIGVHPLHGGGQGFESPQLHHPVRAGYVTIARTKLSGCEEEKWHSVSALLGRQKQLGASAV